ncbi:MAG: TIM barrel protein, partial [Steroidobacteraceae bacterium]
MTDQLAIDPGRFSANCSILFTELPVLQRPAAARAAGFDAVEFWWPFDTAVPPTREVQAFADAVAEADVQLVSLNTYGGDLPGGDRGIASWEDRTPDFLANLDVAIPLAETLNCKVLNVLYGRRMAGADGSEQDDVA